MKSGLLKSARCILGQYCLYLILFYPLAASAALPTLGDPTQNELSPYEERIMGKNFYKAVKSSVPFIEDLAVNDYLTNLGQKLVSQSDQPDKTFNFFILKIKFVPQNSEKLILVHFKKGNFFKKVLLSM